MADTAAPRTEQAAGESDRAEVRFEHRMSDADALMWAIEKDPMLRSTITTVVVLDGTPERDRLWRAFDRVSCAVPRLRQRVRSNPLSLAPPRWEVDPNFDLGYHLRFARVPGEGTVRDLLHMAQPMSMQGFDRARPLWECVVADGLDGDRSALVLKIHHSITDGVGGVRLMLELFDFEVDAPERSHPPVPPVHVMNQAERFVDAFQHQTRRQLGILKRFAAGVPDEVRGVLTDPVGSYESASELLGSVGRIMAPVSKPLSPVMARRSLSTHLDTISLPLDRAKAAGKSVGGTLNDTFVAGLARGMLLYHEEHGASTDVLRMGMPISVRTGSTSDTAGNAFVPARFEIPLQASDPAALMRRVRERMLAARDEPANQLVEPLSNLLNRLPTTVVTQVFATMMKGLDFQASNVPGSPLPLYLLGTPVEAIVPFGPLAGAASNITLLSYQNTLNIGINVDPAAAPDVDVYVDCIRRGYKEVLELAS
jgi:diacylglycerol O-acyltransferase / wax synthase